MSVFLERQDVQQRSQWMKRLRQVERTLLSVLVLIVGLSSLYGLYRVVFLGSIFHVETIVVEGSFHRLTADGVAALSGVRRGENLFWISVGDVYDRLRSEPWIKEVVVRRKLPDTLWIHVREYEPVALLASQGFWYIDAEGHLIKRLESHEDKLFPVLSGLEVAPDGQLADEGAGALQEMLLLLRAFANSHFGESYGVAEVHFDAVDGYSLITQREPLQIFVGHAELAERIHQIDLMRKAIMSRAERIRYMRTNEEGRIIVKYRQTRA